MVSVATPPLAAAVTSPMTAPVPLAWLNVMLSVLSAPLVMALAGGVLDRRSHRRRRSRCKVRRRAGRQ
jgi:hypothetical protein